MKKTSQNYHAPRYHQHDTIANSDADVRLTYSMNTESEVDINKQYCD